MSINKIVLECSYRIALVIDGSSLTGQRLMTGICRRATAYPNLLVRRYFEYQLAEEGIKPLIDWKPDALVVYCDNVALLQKTRSALPHAPVVAMNAIPANLADAIVTGNADEMITLSLAHFSENGLTNFALFYAGDRELADRQADSFRRQMQAYPGTFSSLHQTISTADLLCTPSGKALREIETWLKSLPKPVGIFFPSDHAAAHLVRVCHHAGLNIPKDVQIISCNELDESLECFPHLTCIHLPAERIGGIALKEAINLLRGEASSPTAQLVSGSSIVPQGSTGILPSQLSSIPAAIAYIESNAVRGAGVDDVLHATQYVSRMTFYRDFKNQTGDSPAHYIRRIRLESACRLLITTQMDITRIAELAGFSSSNYFAQIFRREIGMTPNQYRKLEKK
jgi:LacI family transcriptional regulator